MEYVKDKTENITFSESPGRVILMALGFYRVTVGAKGLLINTLCHSPYLTDNEAELMSNN